MYEKIFENIYTTANHFRELTYQRGMGDSLITGDPDKDLSKFYVFFVDGEIQKGCYVTSQAKEKLKQLRKQFPKSEITWSCRKSTEVA